MLKGDNVIKHNFNEYKHLFKRLTDGTLFWKIAIYVRLSKDDGKKVSLSIINQIKLIAYYLRSFEDFEVVEIYIDDGLTGTDFDRDDFKRLQKDINNKDVNCIIVKDLTRFSRNMADGIKQLDEYVLEKGIRFISVDIPAVDTFENPTAISSPEVYHELQQAEDFARTTSKKVRAIKRIKREDGEKNGGFPPYGFLPNPDGEHWLIDPVASEIVKKIFLWSAEGLSDGEIAKKLNFLKVPNPTAYKNSIGLKYHHPNSNNNSGLWWAPTVSKILADKNHIGCAVQGKSSSFDHKRHKQVAKKKEEYVVVEGSHEKAVSNELFKEVEDIRKQRMRICKKTGKVHIFANLVYCSGCKRSMKKTNAGKNEYLVCRTYKELGKEYCNAKHSINFKVLEDIVLKTVQSQISLIVDLHKIVEKINQQGRVPQQSDRIKELIESATHEIKKTERLIDASYYDWKNDEISKDQYQRIRKETEGRLLQLKNTLRILSAEQKQMCEGITSNNEYFEKFLRYKNIDSLERLMLVELIDKIYINEDKSVKIEFKYNNQYLLILDYIEQNNEKQEDPKILKKKK